MHSPMDTTIFYMDHIFEGAFQSYQLGTFHIRTIESYIKSRRAIDIDVIPSSESHRRAGMILWSDVDSTNIAVGDYKWTSQNTCPVSEFSKRSAPIPSEPSLSCGSDGVSISPDVQAKLDQFYSKGSGSLNKRQTGCPAAKMVMPVGVSADCTYVQLYGGTQGALKQILANYNSASQVYASTFNFGLGVVLVKLFTECGGTDNGIALTFNQQCSVSYTISNRLSDFAHWRGQKAADNAGLWHLMSQCNSGATVGIAWLGTACSITANG